MAKRCKGVIDETITDVLKMKEMVTKGELLFAVINVNCYKMKLEFDNVYGCRSGARVFVAECDRNCALQACMEGVQNNAFDENIDHFDKEIDRADLEDLEGVRIDNIMLRVITPSFEMVSCSSTVINVNDCATKFKFHNVYGCRSGARVFVAECPLLNSELFLTDIFSFENLSVRFSSFSGRVEETVTQNKLKHKKTKAQTQAHQPKSYELQDYFVTHLVEESYTISYKGVNEVNEKLFYMTVYVRTFSGKRISVK